MRPSGPCSLNGLPSPAASDDPCHRSWPPLPARHPRAGPQSLTAVAPAQHLSLAKTANLAGGVVRPHRNGLAHGKPPLSLPILDHAAIDSGIELYWPSALTSGEILRVSSIVGPPPVAPARPGSLPAVTLRPLVAGGDLALGGGDEARIHIGKFGVGVRADRVVCYRGGARGAGQRAPQLAAAIPGSRFLIASSVMRLALATSSPSSMTVTLSNQCNTVIFTLLTTSL